MRPRVLKPEGRFGSNWSFLHPCKLRSWRQESLQMLSGKPQISVPNNRRAFNEDNSPILLQTSARMLQFVASNVVSFPNIPITLGNLVTCDRAICRTSKLLKSPMDSGNSVNPVYDMSSSVKHSNLPIELGSLSKSYILLMISAAVSEGTLGHLEVQQAFCIP